MAGIRIRMDLYFQDMTIEQVNKDFPELLPAIKKAKARASKINADTDNEEMTTTAKYHICHHDTGDQPCEPEQEI